MKIIENSKVKEKLYVEKLENGLTIMIIPKKGIQKKYVIWGTNYGSNDSKFVVPGETEETEVPKGVAHFLEHKMFEQESGVNSLDTLTALGVEANAYTTNDHTAYLFECTENFYPALDELMDYVQHPYFTDENVEKEKGIIGQEIMMYDDYPEWKVYLNALEAMYHEHPVKAETIVQEKIEQNMDVSQPLFTIGIKDKVADNKEKVRKHIAIEILLNMIIGKSSKLYKELYDEGLLFSVPSIDYEFSRGYAHILVTGQSPEPEKVYEKFKDTVSKMKESSIDIPEFNRIKKRIYGEYVKEYNDTADIARMFLADFFKEINSFDYLEEIPTINEQYLEQILKNVYFCNKKSIIVI